MLDSIFDLIPMTYAQQEELQQKVADLEEDETKSVSITDSNGNAWQCRITRSSFEFENDRIKVSQF